MSRIKGKFDQLKENRRKALITFITAGDPDLATTGRLVREMEQRGADIIELGIPYSDPIAEGPVIQQANARAMKHNIKMKDVMEKVREMRREVTVPLVYLLYYNCILQYGPERFFSDCEQVGVDGVIIPDLPFEEREEIEEVSSQYDVDVITMVSPTSRERIQKITQNARGFLYCVSSLGVTGIRSEFTTDFDEFFSYIDQAVNIPKAIGFGISTPDHIRKLKRYSDGLIVGSAVVRRVEESKDAEEAVKNVGDYIATLRSAMDED